MPGYEHLAPQILNNYVVRKIDSATFRFNGKECAQSEDFSIMITCKDNTDRNELIG